MSEIWDQVRVQEFIEQAIEESLTLDYKAAGALAKSDEKKKEITKDVSAMANSAGGILIYGIAEFQDKDRKHLPEKLDPIDRIEISKEWLDQVIGTIQPKIDTVIVHPVPIINTPNKVIYVVEIPQSSTAHQARDKRYYKRSNFESIAMEDYEIRDVMGRRQYARIELEFKIAISIQTESSPLYEVYNPLREKSAPKKHTIYELEVTMRNTGKVYAQYVDAFIELPCDFLFDRKEGLRKIQGLPNPAINLASQCRITQDNTARDLIKGNNSMIGPPAEYGPVRYIPILPSISLRRDDFRLNKDFERIDWEAYSIRWKTHVDNAPPHSGEIKINDIEIVDHRGDDENFV
jgi:hypothetical protein